MNPTAGPRGLWAELMHRHRAWTWCAAVAAALAVAFLIASQIDQRTLYDVSVWSKPAKFSISFVAYFATLAWFVPLLGASYPTTIRGRILTGLPILCALFEMGYIGAMAARGEPSHFNFSTPFHAIMYALMGVAAVLLVLVCLWMGVRILWHSYLRSAVKDLYVLAVGIGLIVTFALGGGFGGNMSASSGHWVGTAATDAGGLPLFHWSRAGGDLRVAHFFGMHAMQVLPVAAVLVSGWLSRSRATLAVVMFAIAYAVLTTGAFIQALRGHPFI